MGESTCWDRALKIIGKIEKGGLPNVLREQIGREILEKIQNSPEYNMERDFGAWHKWYEDLKTRTDKVQDRVTHDFNSNYENGGPFEPYEPIYGSQIADKAFDQGIAEQNAVNSRARRLARRFGIMREQDDLAAHYAKDDYIPLDYDKYIGYEKRHNTKFNYKDFLPTPRFINEYQVENASAAILDRLPLENQWTIQDIAGNVADVMEDKFDIDPYSIRWDSEDAMNKLGDASFVDTILDYVNGIYLKRHWRAKPLTWPQIVGIMKLMTGIKRDLDAFGSVISGSPTDKYNRLYDDVVYDSRMRGKFDIPNDNEDMESE